MATDSTATRAPLTRRLLSLLVLVLALGVAWAAPGQLAPLNPEFIAARNAPPHYATGPGGVQYRLGLRPMPIDFSRVRGRLTFPRSLVSFSSKYDLRTQGRVTSVKDQGPLGTCWAFATYGALESCLLPTETWDFSEKNMKNLAGFDWDPNDDGGNLLMSSAYLARWDGPIAEADDPYSVDPGSLYSPTNLPRRKHIQDIIYLPGRSSSTDNNNIKQALQTYGAVYTSYYADNAPYNAGTYSYYYAGSANANHAVTIVGWDDTYARSKFLTTPPGDGAFIVKNSWGSAWGESGYFYVSYYDAQLGRSLNAVFPWPESPTNYSRNYQYDPLGMTVSYYPASNSPTGWFANVFTAQATETISAASWYASVPGADYTLRVYRNPTGGPIGSGTLVSTQSGTLEFMGYQTVKLATPMPVTAGERFSVVVRLTTFTGDYMIPLEYPIQGYSGGATASAGQSYVSADGSSWSDISLAYANTNVCLKAFASPTVSTGVATPVISPDGGTFGDSVAVTLSCDTAGASIFYTKNGSTPTATASATNFAYSGPITLSATTTVKAKAFKSGLTASDVASATFTKVAVPTGVVYFMSNRGSKSAIYRMKADGTQQTPVTTNSGWNDGLPSVTGDGQTIVFVSDRVSDLQIYKMNANGSGQTRLSNRVEALETCPVVSKDGQFIAFLSNRDHLGEIDNYGDPIYEIYTMDLNGNNVRRITSLDGGVSGLFDINPQNGNQIVFATDYSYGTSDPALYLANLTTNALTRVNLPSSTYFKYIETPVFSPDGTKIVFGAEGVSAWEELYSVRLDGSALTQITTGGGGYNWMPRFNSAGDKLVYVSYRNSLLQIYRVDVNGANVTNLTQTGSDEAYPFWSDPQTAGTVATPTFTPAPGSYDGSVTVTLACATSGASIRYTKNGSVPTLATSSTCFAYSAPITLTSSATLNVKAFKTGLTDSGMASGAYTIAASANRAPTATAQAVTAQSGIARTITLKGTDPDGDRLTYAIASAPQHGKLTGSGANITYTSTAGYGGRDAFTFTVSDGELTSDPATVTITVQRVNHAPKASAQKVTTPKNTPLAIPLSVSDPDGDTLTIVVTKSPKHGALSPFVNGRVTYTPFSAYAGADTFSYKAFDGAAYSAVVTVAIAITPVNYPPTALPQTVTAVEGVAKAITLKGSDPDGNKLTYFIVSRPQRGTLTGRGAKVTYKAGVGFSGTDSFTFMASDGKLTSAPATVTVNVQHVNHAPKATSQKVTTAGNQPVAIVLNATDIDVTDTLTLNVKKAPRYGFLSAYANGRVTYTPNPYFAGKDSFSYTVSDNGQPRLTSRTATVSITVRR